MVIGFFLAMLVKREARGVGFARALIYYPNIAPTIGFATVWTYLLTPTVGFISQVAKMMGVTAPDFLNDPQYAIYTIMVVYLWREAGFVMIFLHIRPAEYFAGVLRGGADRRRFALYDAAKDHPAAGKAHHRICAYVYDGQLL